MIAISTNFFYTVTLPCTLWFLDRGKAISPLPFLGEGPGVRAQDTVLFIDARSIYTQLDRAHREFTPEQIAFIASLVRLYRREGLNGYTFDPQGLNLADSQTEILQSAFSDRRYLDVPGLCKVANRDEIAAQGWSLNPGRYIGVAKRGEDDYDFVGRLEELNEELEMLNAEAHDLEERIANNIDLVLRGTINGK
jgi:type I restriction enzyme M protein